MKNQIIEYDDRSAYEIITDRRELRIVAFGDPLNTFLDIYEPLEVLLRIFNIDEVIGRMEIPSAAEGENEVIILPLKTVDFSTYSVHAILLDNKILTYGFRIGKFPKKEVGEFSKDLAIISWGIDNKHDRELLRERVYSEGVVVNDIIKKEEDECIDELVFKWLDKWEIHELCNKENKFPYYLVSNKDITIEELYYYGKGIDAMQIYDTYFMEAIREKRNIIPFRQIIKNESKFKRR